ncbi:MAG: type 4a pilus biogenesis protein PilO [Phycisphaerales bacterium]|nr:type 4a pilus biogenesis protein PilO [Phycisphaerales bacterium]
MMNSHARQVLYVCVLLAVPLSAWYFVFIPRNADIDRTTRAIAEREDQLQLISTAISQMGDVRQAVLDGEAAIERVEAKLPSRQDVESILEQVWQVARRNDLTVKSVKTMPAVTSTVYRELPLRVDLEGSFEGYYRFLLELENLPRITRIFNMRIKRPSRSRMGDDDRPGDIHAEFELSIYFSDETSSLAWTRETTR